MGNLPFTRSIREVIRSVNALTEPSWVKAGEIVDYLEENEGDADNIDDVISSLNLVTIGNRFWEFYSELAFCALDRDNVSDLHLVGMYMMFNNVSEQLVEAFRIQGRNVAIFVSSLREDQSIPNDLATLVKLAGDAAYYMGGVPVPGRAVPSGLSSKIGKFLHDQFFYKTQDLYTLDLKESNVFLQKVALPLEQITQHRNQGIPLSRQL